jgi:hypothetical protein
MRAQGLDPLVLAQPVMIRNATGASPDVATFWRRAGAAFLLPTGVAANSGVILPQSAIAEVILFASLTSSCPLSSSIRCSAIHSFHPRE